MVTSTDSTGAVVVGYSQIGARTTQHAFRWTSAGMTDLGSPAGPTRDSRALDVSPSGTVIVGDATLPDQSAFTGFRSGAFRWTAAQGFQDLGALAPGFPSIATAVSADGAVVVDQGGIAVHGDNATSPSS
jgi:probable HAF family extracellular repeat protein